MTICNPNYPPCRNPMGVGAMVIERDRQRYGARMMSFPRMNTGMGASAVERNRHGASMFSRLNPGMDPGMGELTVGQTVWAGVSLASVALSTYHGYKRNQSIGWAILWGFLGGLFPVVVPAIAVAQGFGERAR